MKKLHSAFTSFVLAALFTACNSGPNTAKVTETKDDTGNAVSNNTSNNNNTNATSTATNANMPLNTADSTFVSKAAMGGMMEVEAGRLAQQNAQNPRVKAFGAMMERDHSTANQELMRFTSGRGMTLPTAMPADMQKHMDAMRNMKGKAFDAHYMKMMVDDHQKDVADFQKQANGGTDPELKSFAKKTLPVLQMHRDSALAINKGIK